MSLGAAGQHKASVTIDARVDSADRQIRKLARRIDHYERALEKAKRKQSQIGRGLDALGNRFDSAKKHVDKLSKVLGAAGLVSAAFGAVQALDQLVQSTTKYENVMRNLPFSIEKAKGATMGLVDGYELSKAAIQAHRLGVVQTEEDFAKLAEAGTKLALTVGEDASKGVADLTLALGRGSAAVLDNLGITLKAEEAQREYAKRLGVSIDALTGAQKAEAFRVIGLERALLASAKTNVVIDEGARKWNETKHQAMEFAREVLPRVLDVLELAFDAFETYIEFHERMYAAVDMVIDETMRFLELGAIYDEQVTSVRGLTQAYAELGLAASTMKNIEGAFEAAEVRERETAELLEQERLRGEQEAVLARIVDEQQKAVGAIDKQLALRKAQGAREVEINGLLEHRALLQADFLEEQQKGEEAEEVRWQERLRAEAERSAKREKWRQQARALRAAEDKAEVATLERRADLLEAHGRRTFQVELQILEVKRQQLEAARPKDGAERVRIAQALLNLDAQRQIKLIEIEALVRDEAAADRRREVEETGALELGRLEHRAELLTRNAELEADSWTTRLAAIEADRAASLEQLELRRQLLELEYGDEVFTNKAALAELEQLEHDRELGRIETTIRKREWAASRDAALRAEQQKRAQHWAKVIGHTESSVQTALKGTSKLYDLAAQAQGVSSETRQKVATKLGGVEMLVMGAVETGKAIAAYASFNYIQGALHTAAAGFNFVEGALLLSGKIPQGGGSVVGGSGAGGAPSGGGVERETGAAASIPESVPGATPSSDVPPAGAEVGGSGSGGGTVNIQIQALGSVDEGSVVKWGEELASRGQFGGGVG